MVCLPFLKMTLEQENGLLCMGFGSGEAGKHEIPCSSALLSISLACNSSSLGRGSGVGVTRLLLDLCAAGSLLLVCYKLKVFNQIDYERFAHSHLHS